MRQATYLILVGETAVGLGLVIWGLGARSLWQDETVSAGFAQLPLGRLIHVLEGREANMGIYHLGLHFWRVLGSSEFDLRLLSALLAIAAIGVVVLLGRALFDNLTGLVAGGLLVVNLFWLGYAQEARGYALALLMTALATLLLVRGLARPAWPTCAAYAVCILVGVWAHYFVLLVLLVHLLSLLWRRRDGRVGRFIRRTAPLLVAGFVLPASYVLVQQGHVSSDRLDWIWTPGTRDLLWLSRLLAGGQSVSGGAGIAVTAAWVLFGVGVGLGAAALILSPRDRRREPGAGGQGAGEPSRGWGLSLVLLWLFLPVVAVFVFSVTIKPLFADKYFIICLPAAVLLMGRGLALIVQRARLVGVVVGLLVIGLTVPGHLRWYGSPPKQDWKEATGFIASNASTADAVLLADPNSTSPAFDYYWGRFRPGFVLRHGNATTATVGRVLAAGRPPVVWIVFYFDRTLERRDGVLTARALSSSQYQLIADRVFTGYYDPIEVAAFQELSAP